MNALNWDLGVMVDREICYKKKAVREKSESEGEMRENINFGH